ncbi:hypothetical protein JOE11_005069 [Robbsia andropogonis]|uniref:hypothetical protein n=1 Tax=Robbsia andropogonis TaxID=28092 RepID=UPI003D1E0BA2
MADLKNFLNERHSAFSAHVVDAAMRNADNDDYSSMLLELLDKAHAVTLGTAEILNMQRQNALRRNDFLRADADGLEPPVGDFTMSVLAGLAQVACEAITSEIEETADWLDTRQREAVIKPPARKRASSPKGVE